MPETLVQVLLVEDNPNDVELTLQAFRRNNVTEGIHVARDGAEALDFLFCTGAHAGRDPASGPRLILLDLKLPKVDGLEVLRRVKANPQTRLIPLVVLTSSSQERDVAESYRSGANSYLVKPIDFNRLKHAVRSIIAYWLALNEPPLRRAA
jgi:two-component system response regulator